MSYGVRLVLLFGGALVWSVVVAGLLVFVAVESAQ